MDKYKDGNIMKNNIKILDTTLRDGGYINNWHFNKNVGNSIYTALIDSNANFVECGYLSDKSNNGETTIFKSISSINSYFNSYSNNMVAMVNHGDFDIKNLDYHKNTKLYGIRLAFHKKNIFDVKEEATQIKKKGYKLFFQPMVTKSYSEIEFIELMHIANEIKPYAFYIVDSFGSIDKKDFIRYLSLADHILDDSISIGFHGHNNMQFVFSNAINMIENITSRNIIIDSSISGMGRGAGNLNTEIIMDYLNKYYSSTYTIEPLLEIMDGYLETLYKQTPWGFTPAQYLSAKHNCHPNYASFLTNKKRLAISSIDSILSQISEKKKVDYDIQYIDTLYLNYNKKKFTSSVKLSENYFDDREILVLGSGPSIKEEKEKILEIINKKNLVIVSLNNIAKDFNPNIQFFSNQKRYNEYKEDIDLSKLVVTSNITTGTNHKKCQTINFEETIKKSTNSYDNVLSIFLSFISDTNVNKILLAGIDGYHINQNNYTNEELFINDNNFIENENKELYKSISEFSKKFNIEFITQSLFKSAVSLKILGVIPARYKSSRFEGKPLCLIKNIPMIKRTYEQAKKSKHLTDLLVATDNEKIKSYCESENIPVIMTSENCLTGTDRIAEVSQTLNYDLYINIQGDEPVIDPVSIDEVIFEYKKYGDEYIAYNLYKVIDEKDEIESSTIIKTIVNEKDELMYMSRLGIPFNKSNKNIKYKKQVCVYGFTKQALNIFSTRKKTNNEQFEDIEILRFVDMGYKVKMKETFVDSIAVDIPEDVKKVERFLEQKGFKGD